MKNQGCRTNSEAAVMTLGLLGLALALIGAIASTTQACPECDNKGLCAKCDFFGTIVDGGNMASPNVGADNDFRRRFDLEPLAFTTTPTLAQDSQGNTRYCITLTSGFDATGDDVRKVCYFSDSSATTVGAYNAEPSAIRQVSHFEVAQTGTPTFVSQYGTCILKDDMYVTSDPGGKELFKEFVNLDSGIVTRMEQGEDTFDRTGPGTLPECITQTRKNGTQKVKETFFFYNESGSSKNRRVTEVEYNSDGSKRFTTSIYTYYGEGSDAGQLRWVIRPEGVNQALTNSGLIQGINPDKPGDPCGLDNEGYYSGLSSFANVLYEAPTGGTAYDSAGRPTHIKRVGGAGCCSSAGGDEEVVTFFSKTPTDTWNDWSWCRQVQTPSHTNLRSAEFYNSHDKVVYQVRWLTDGSNVQEKWITHTVYYTSSDTDSAAKEGRVKEVRHPAACSGYTVTPSNGCVVDVQPVQSTKVGLVECYDYHSPSGNMSMTGTKTSISGATNTTRAYQYSANGTSIANGVTIWRPTAEIVYAGSDGSQTATTSYTYSYYGSTHAVATQTTAYTPVSTSKNGSNVATTVTYHYYQDLSKGLYYNDWTCHEDGSYTYTAMGTGYFNKGQVVKTVEDASTTADGSLPGGMPVRSVSLPAPLRVTTTYAYYGDDPADVGALGRLKYVTAGSATSTTKKTVYAYMSTQASATPTDVTTTSLVTLVAPHMDSTSSCYGVGTGYNYGPVQITVTDLDGRTLVSATGNPSTRDNGNVASNWVTTGTVDGSFTAFLHDGAELWSRTVSSYDDTTGKLASVVSWPDAASATVTLTTAYAYNASTGLLEKVRRPDGTVTFTEYDDLGRTKAVYMGTSTHSNLADVAKNELTKISETFYDKSATPTVGDGHVTETRQYTGLPAGSEYAATYYVYDNRGRLWRTLSPGNVATERDLDYLGRATTVRTYANSSGDANGITPEDLRAVSDTRYDEKGQVYQTVAYAVAAGSSTGSSMTTNFWYDECGRLIKTADPKGIFSKTAYDAAGRTLRTYLSYDPSETSYNNAKTPTGDIVIEQTKYLYDDAGNVRDTRNWQRIPGSADIGELTTTGARLTASAAWYDELGRVVREASYGTVAANFFVNSDTGTDLVNYLDPDVYGASHTYASCKADSTPTYNSNDHVIVTTYAQSRTDTDGHRYTEVTDNLGRKTRTVNDDVGRVMKVIENYINGTVEPADTDKDRTTEYIFDSMGRLAWQSAWNATGNTVVDQRTYYVYPSASGTCVDASLPTRIVYPDAAGSVTVGAGNITTSTTTDCVALAYDRLGRTASRTDQRGTVHAYTYVPSGSAGAGRLQIDAVAALGGADNYVRAMKLTYDDVGRTKFVTSWSGSDATGDVRNEVAFAYDGETNTDLGWGGVKRSQQEHAGVVTSSSPSVVYSYDVVASGSAVKSVRLASVTYPTCTASSGVIYYNVPAGTGVDAVLSRTGTIASSPSPSTDSQKYAVYTYLGAQTVVQVDHPAITGGLKLTYIEGHDVYLSNNGFDHGFDRFGRVILQTWKIGAGTICDQQFYKYDGASNRVWRVEASTTFGDGSRDELYDYDGLNRLVQAQRGRVLNIGDANRDGSVDGLDYNSWQNGYQQPNPTFATGDFNMDGSVDGLDYNAWQNDYSHTMSFTKTSSWSLDSLGNWAAYTVIDSNGTNTQTRAHDAANEMTAINSATTHLAHDFAGNMTSVPKPGDETNHHLVCTYDAWNRMVKVVTDAGTPVTVGEYRYDGTNRRITKLVPNATTSTHWDRTDYFYNESWQCLEERKAVDQPDKEAVAATPSVQWLWDLRYIDAPACRWRSVNGTLDECLFYCNDANMNVTALVDSSTGTVTERYMYDPYGQPTICDANWTPRAGNTSAYANEILFCGYRYDPETGQYQVRHRYYQPTLGRWTTMDSQGYVDGMSMFQYCGSRPTYGLDPLGDAMPPQIPWSDPRYPALPQTVSINLWAKEECNYTGEARIEETPYTRDYRVPDISSIASSPKTVNYVMRDCKCLYKCCRYQYALLISEMGISSSWIRDSKGDRVDSTTEATMTTYASYQDYANEQGYLAGLVADIATRSAKDIVNAANAPPPGTGSQDVAGVPNSVVKHIENIDPMSMAMSSMQKRGFEAAGRQLAMTKDAYLGQSEKQKKEFDDKCSTLCRSKNGSKK